MVSGGLGLSFLMLLPWCSSRGPSGVCFLWKVKEGVFLVHTWPVWTSKTGGSANGCPISTVLCWQPAQPQEAAHACIQCLKQSKSHQLEEAVECHEGSLTKHDFRAVKKLACCLALAPSLFPPSFTLSL